MRTEVTDGRVLLHVGNFMFEVVVPPTLVDFDGAVEHCAELVERELNRWRDGD